MAAYGRAGDVIRFYEINPAVEQLARSLFTYTRESRARVEVVTGDARRSLEQEPPGERFDVLAVDAFSGDAVPVHLLTREAMAMFRLRLRPGGVIAFHCVKPVPGPGAGGGGGGAGGRGSRRGWWSRRRWRRAGSSRRSGCWWQSLAGPLAEGGALRERSEPVPMRAGVRAWTDGYSSLLLVVRWSGHLTFSILWEVPPPPSYLRKVFKRLRLDWECRVQFSLPNAAEGALAARIRARRDTGAAGGPGPGGSSRGGASVVVPC